MVFGVWMVDIALVVVVGVGVAVVPWVSIPLKCCRYLPLVVRAFRGVVVEVIAAVSTGRVVLQGFLLHGTLLRVPLQYRGGSRIGHPDGP